jgi:hypothetical protein
LRVAIAPRHLRYHYNGPFSKQPNQTSNFIPAVGLLQVGKAIHTLCDRDWNNFGVGADFAFDPRGTEKTAPIIRVDGQPPISPTDK